MAQHHGGDGVCLAECFDFTWIHAEEFIGLPHLLELGEGRENLLDSDVNERLRDRGNFRHSIQGGGRLGANRGTTRRTDGGDQLRRGPPLKHGHTVCQPPSDCLHLLDARLHGPVDLRPQDVLDLLSHRLRRGRGEGDNLLANPGPNLGQPGLQCPLELREDFYGQELAKKRRKPLL